MPRWVWRGVKKEVPKKTVGFLRHFYTEIIPRNPPVGQVVFVAQKTTVFFGNEHGAHRGNEMNMLRKIFLVVICALVIYPVHAKFYAGYRNECWVDDKGSDEYWFCGNQTESCQGNKATKTNKKNWIYDGKGFVHAGRTFWCCGGTGEKEGKFVEGLTWTKSSTKKTKSVGGGTCEYTERTTVCDTTETDDCTVPTSCPSDKMLRNRACVSKCPSGQGFKSLLSNECIACTGDDRGVDEKGRCHKCLLSSQHWDGSKCTSKGDSRKEADAAQTLNCLSGQGKDSSGKCVACSGLTMGVDASGNCKTCASGQIWDSGTKACKDKPQETPKEEPKQETPKTNTGCKSFEYESPVSGKCISKSAAKQYSRDMFYKCYACATDTRFKSCLDIYRRAPDNLSSAQEKVLRACNIDPSAYNPTEAKEYQSNHESGLGKKKLPKLKEKEITTKAIDTSIIQSKAIDLNTVSDVAYGADMLAM